MKRSLGSASKSPLVAEQAPERLWGRLAAAILVLAVASPAAAQQRGMDISRLRPALDAEGFVGIQATATPGPGRWNVGLYTGWATDPLVLRLGDDETDVIDHRVVSSFLVQVGIGGRFSFGLDLPLLLYQDAEGELLGDGRGQVGATGLGDPRLLFRYRFFGEDSNVARERNEGPGIALQGGLTLPVGDERAFFGEHGVTTDLGVTGDFHILGAGVGATLGWKHRFEPRNLLDVRFRDELSAGAALKLPIPVTRDFLGIVEFRAVTDAGDPFDGPTTVVEGDLALRLRRGDVAVTAGVGRGFTGGVGSPEFRALASLHWAPRVHDSDDDQIPDDRDECPYLPEDFDGFQDSDGCLDPDNDNDLIPDADDRCPNEQAEEFRDEDEDGCTDPLRDRDRDGIPDHEDSCPTVPEDQDGFEDDDGCPEEDNDVDDVPDEQDECPDEPEDLDGFEDEDGCPDPDNDGDGVLDADDQCPTAAEDADEHDDEDGCPDPDDDRDGVLDGDDECPDEAETINGVRDGDGCPDRGGRALWQIEGDPSEADYTLRGTVRFSRDHSLARAGTRSVDQLARLVVAGWPHRFRVAVGTEEPTRLGALKAALAERGLDDTRVLIESDAELEGASVVVTRAPVEHGGAQGDEDAQEPESDGDGTDAVESE